MRSLCNDWEECLSKTRSESEAKGELFSSTSGSAMRNVLRTLRFQGKLKSYCYVALHRGKDLPGSDHCLWVRFRNGKQAKIEVEDKNNIVLWTATPSWTRRRLQNKFNRDTTLKLLFKTRWLILSKYAKDWLRRKRVRVHIFDEHDPDLPNLQLLKRKATDEKEKALLSELSPYMSLFTSLLVRCPVHLATSVLRVKQGEPATKYEGTDIQPGVT